MTQRGNFQHGRPGGYDSRPPDRGDRAEQMAEITAPYGFVPLGPVVEPAWLHPALTQPFLHDVPFEDGVAGTFELVIEAETPICVAGRSDDKERRNCKIGSTYAIPGSSLRGALRNVVEAATFSRMTLVNDHRYAVRDLQNRDLYLDHMASIQTNLKTHKKEPMPLVNAGWLVCRVEDDEERVVIEPCHFAKIEYGWLEELAFKRGVRGFQPGEKQSSVDKYKKWGGAPLDFKGQVMLARSPKPPQVISEFGKALNEGKPIEGTLVFTGQPSRHDPTRKGKGKGAGNAKHHDFVFYGRITKDIPVDEKQLADFQFAHSDRGQQHRMTDAPNTEWGYWKPEFEAGKRVPVFFLLHPDGTLRAMGLAMMFRLSYAHSVHDLLTRSGHDPRSRSLDLAEGLFGTVRKLDQKNTLTLRGRVQLGHAIAQGAPKEEPPRTEVLGAPKASYYPNYITQRGPNGRAATGRDGGLRYDTYMNDDPEVRLRGWKRFHPQTQTTKSFLTAKINLDRVGTTFRPLAAGTRFVATVNVHNLRPIELGALLWALDFGGDKQARHTLGLARPLGYGRCRLSASQWTIRNLVGGASVDPNAAVQAFVLYMEDQLGQQWAASHMIRELIAIARPKNPDEVRYQRLDSEKRINEFVDAKKAGLSLKSWADGVYPQLKGTGTAASPTGTSPSRPASSAPASSSVGPSRRTPWPGMRRGDTVEVVLIEQNKKGKWRAEATRYEGVGTLDGTAPADAEKDKVYKVEVVAGNDAKNLNLKWPV